MAILVNQISVANTFGEWVTSTVQLINESNTLGYSDWQKPTGTLYLAEPTVGLNVTGNIIASNVTVNGVFSLAGTMQVNNSIQVGTYANTTYLNVTGPGLSANVANNMTIGGTLTVSTINVNTLTNAYLSSSFAQANVAYNYAGAAFLQANAAYVLASSDLAYTTAAFNKANTVGVLSQAGYNQANTGTVLAQSGFDKANSANTLAQSGFDKANSANTLAQSGFDKANSANTLAQSGFDQANSANTLAQSAFNKANTGPAFTSQSSSYQLQLSDVDGVIYLTSGSAVTIPANTTVGFANGSRMKVINGTSGSITLDSSSVTSYTSNTSNTGLTGNRTLAQYGVSELIKVGTDLWYISGFGLT